MVAAALVEAMSMHGARSQELVIFWHAAGAMSNGEQFYGAVLKSRSSRSMARWVGTYMPQKPILDALELVGLRLPMQVVSNACSSGTNSIGHAFNIIRDGLNSCVICGGYDPLSELVFVGFDSLQASTPEKIRPFDLHRSGLVLGEGSAVLFLESEDPLRTTKSPPSAETPDFAP